MKNNVTQAIVTVKGQKPTPWDNGVKVTLLGDTTNLDNLIKELKEVKALVNSDVNKSGMALNEVDVSIKIVGGALC